MTGSNKTVFQIYKRLMGYALPHWPRYTLAMIGMAIYAFTQAAFASLMKPLLDKGILLHDSDAIHRLPPEVIGLFLLRGLADFLAAYNISWVGRSIIKRMREETFGQLLRLPSRYYDSISSGMLLSKITYNIEQIADATTNSVTVLVRDGLTIVGLIAVMFYQSWVLSLFILVVMPIIALLVRYISERFRRYSRRIQDSMGDVTKVADEIITGQRIVKLFGGHDHEAERFGQVNEKNRYLNMKLMLVNAGSSPIIQLIAGAGLAGVIYVALRGQSVTPGSFISFLAAILLLLPSLKHVTDINAPLQRGIAAGQSIFELLDDKVEDEGGSFTLSRATGELEFRDVTFGYSETKGAVLHDISFKAAPGETIALVGRSGSGKSTLVSLLPRFYDPGAGAILLDGRDLREYTLRNVREQVAMVSQDVMLFNDTIRNNIAYGSLDKRTEADIVAAAEAAYAMPFIQRLPQGLDTMVGDRGVLLSGGERQRLSIARALLKNAPVLILDEATSALDSESERHIQAALEGLMANRTTLVIAHRLSTVERADRIIVMDRGRIVEMGRHAELIAKNGQYAALHRLQFRDSDD
ncbi:MAG TPA: lipid A export permease/ATP-binding protein MsbA [Gammaproteobacteria bacterium]|jgi:subfamily B ATP-binding cassette protein MsbA|nr:lipid A export permease/ATP-binding protein MsbA [Gammaproteobacteria bacterium]